MNYIRLAFNLIAIVIVIHRSSAQNQKPYPCGTSLRANRGDGRLRSPWTAILFLKTGSKNGNGNGGFVDWIGGVIVGPTTIVTRGRQFWEPGPHNSASRPSMNGQYLHSRNVLVGVGIGNRKTFRKDEFTQILEVEYIVPHPQSHLEHSEYDFAIIKLKSSIKFSSRVHAICVPGTDSGLDLTFDPNSPKRLSGFTYWGNHTLMTVDYKTKPTDVCDANCQKLVGTGLPSSTGAQFENSGPPCPLPPNGPGQDYSNFFLVGSVLSAWHIQGWYLAGLVTKTYGCSQSYSHFISRTSAAKSSLQWIHASINAKEETYTCVNGQIIRLNLLCNGQVDCKEDGGSDENSGFCTALTAPDGGGGNTGKDAIARVKNGLNSFIEVELAADDNNNRWGQGQGVRPRPPPTQSSPAPTTTVSTTAAWVHPLTVTTVKPTTIEPTTTTTAAASGSGCRPRQLSEGMIAQCKKPDGTSSSDCTGLQPPGTKVRLSCSDQYKPASSFSFAEWTCVAAADGEWLAGNSRAQAFACILECGVPKAELTPHIVNGTDAAGSNWPWTAGLFRSRGKGFAYICGATLIGKDALVTAAHCVTDADGVVADVSNFRIVLTPTSIGYEENRVAGSQIVEVKSIHVPQHYNPVTFEGDIGLVRTATGTPIEISNLVYPACYPHPGRESSQLERYQTSPGSTGIVVGFGTDDRLLLTDNLKKVLLPVVSVRDCFKVLDIFPSSTQICAGYTTGISVCNGDSGSGLLFQEEGTRKLYYVQGIVSHGQALDGHYCDYNRYSIFTRVGAFKEWIEEILSRD